MEVMISVPFSGSLKKPSGWSCYDKNGYLFYIFRYHMLFLERQSSRLPCMGQRLRKFNSLTGQSAKIIERIVTTETVTDFSSSLSRHFENSDDLRSISSSLASKLALQGFGSFDVGIKTQLTETLKQGLTQETTLNRTNCKQITHTISVERNISDNIAKEYVAPACYQEWCLDGYLSYVDFLFISYERHGLQITRRRIKKPSAANSTLRKDQPNFIRLGNAPICCIKYWKPLSVSNWIEEERYRLEVEYPDEICFCKPERNYQGYCTPPYKRDIPSLYALAEKAFPRKYDREFLAV